MNVNWQIIVLDFLLMTAWAWLGVTYISNNRKWRGTCLILAALSLVTLTIGDIGTAMGYSGGGDHWYFDRAFRGLPWRCTTVVAFFVQVILIKVKSF